jgi:hypothetical protein
MLNDPFRRQYQSNNRGDSHHDLRSRGSWSPSRSCTEVSGLPNGPTVEFSSRLYYSSRHWNQETWWTLELEHLFYSSRDVEEITSTALLQ